MNATALAPVEQKKLLTVEEAWELLAEGHRFELVKGEMVEMPPYTGAEHGEITSAVADVLRTYIKRHHLGRTYGAETGFVVARNPDTVRAADFAFVSNTRLPEGRITKAVPVAPDLAVEVVSPTDRTSEVNEKVREYLEAGTRLVWVIEPELRTITVYRSLDRVSVFTFHDTLSGEEVVPGFSCKVSELFE